MATVYSILTKLNRVNNTQVLRREMANIVMNDQLVIEAKQDEFEQGLRPDGNIIGQYAWDSYEQLKRQMNPRADGNVDLKLTGSTHKGLFVKKINGSTAGQSFIFNSRDDKWKGLVSKYGSDIMGLANSTFADLQRKEYLSKFIKKIKNISGLK